MSRPQNHDIILPGDARDIDLPGTKHTLGGAPEVPDRIAKKLRELDRAHSDDPEQRT